jgi:hypothetical protein
VISLSYVRLVTVSLPLERLHCREFRFIASHFLSAVRSMLAAK